MVTANNRRIKEITELLSNIFYLYFIYLFNFLFFFFLLPIRWGIRYDKYVRNVHTIYDLRRAIYSYSCLTKTTGRVGVDKEQVCSSPDFYCGFPVFIRYVDPFPAIKSRALCSSKVIQRTGNPTENVPDLNGRDSWISIIRSSRKNRALSLNKNRFWLLKILLFNHNYNF